MNQSRWTVKFVWFGVFLGLMLIGGSWAIATPLDGTPDERAHIIHAAGVAGGDFFPKPEAAAAGTGVFHEVPRALKVQCDQGSVLGFCSNLKDPHALVRESTYVGRYNPLYYVAVGLPIRISPNMAGLLASRLISVLLVTVTLTGAVYCAARWSRHRAVIPALVVAGTPLLFHLTGAINPNALEIAAGVLLFSALVPLAGSSTQLNVACIRLAGIAAIVLVTLRGVGPVWFGIALVAVMFGVRRARLREFARSATARRWAAAVTLAGILAVSWTILMKASEVAHVPPLHVSKLGALRITFLNRWGSILTEMVGNFGYLSTPLPGIVVFAWAAVVGFLLIGVLIFGHRPVRLGLLVLILAGIAVPTAVMLKTANEFGFFWQGRYSLPLAVGVPIIGAQGLAAAGVLTSSAVRRLTRVVVVLLLPVHLLALWMMLIRWQHRMAGVSGLGSVTVNPLSSSGWRPPLGALFPLVMMVAGLILVGWTYTFLVRREVPDTDQGGNSPQITEAESSVTRTQPGLSQVV